MVVDVIQKETQSFIFQGDYYELKIGNKKLQKIYYDIHELDDERFLILVEDWVRQDAKPIKGNRSGIIGQPGNEIFENSINELTKLISKFMKEEVADWKENVDDNIQTIKSYNLKDSEVEEGSL